MDYIRQAPVAVKIAMAILTIAYTTWFVVDPKSAALLTVATVLIASAAIVIDYILDYKPSKQPEDR